MISLKRTLLLVTSVLVVISGCARLLEPVVLPTAQIDKINASVTLIIEPGEPVLITNLGQTFFMQLEGLDIGPALQQAFLWALQQMFSTVNSEDRMPKREVCDDEILYLRVEPRSLLLSGVGVNDGRFVDKIQMTIYTELSITLLDCEGLVVTEMVTTERGTHTHGVGGDWAIEAVARDAIRRNVAKFMREFAKLPKVRQRLDLVQN